MTQEVPCPVCGTMMVPALIDNPGRSVPGGAPESDPAAGTKAFYDGTWYYLCSLACRQKFAARPDDYR